MLEQIAALVAEQAETEAHLADPAVISDPERLQAAGRRYKELEEVLTVGRPLQKAHEDLAAARELVELSEGDDRELFRAEVGSLEADIERLEDELRALLLPSDPNDGRNVIVEIRGAEGGEEANLFARDLFDMYQAFAVVHGWSTEVLESRDSDMGGFSYVMFLAKGGDAWTRLKYEGGVHRVQRVPATESQGRVHTSSATVSVLPEADEIEVQIDDNDLQVDVYRASGPGGQSVNTTDSAVRITHKPTGLVVSMQDEKSQLQNKTKALRVLRSRLLQVEQDRQQSEASEARRGQVGGGGRSEKIRTYNFKENRLTDHRIALTLHKLDRILAGDLEEVTDSLLADERTRQLAEGLDGGS
ncbi:MAG: peptide chain release factor 1 [Acidimicrobiia bacterium]|nr:peptide chain release factor 1 [Actinomycetota bacterium]MBL6924217.1 peptide chain release factor 1 [Acidimicrobiia bacterium]MBL6926845.1 peptide chain release factor 1 [Acidimicrobiia bacterium]